MPDPFDFSVLQSISQQAGERAKAIPGEETQFIDALNTLSEQQAQLQNATMVAKAAADNKASTYAVQNQATKEKILKAEANPFHDIVAFFTDDQSKDELYAEQQKLAYHVTTLANSYQAVAAQNAFKSQSLQAQIDKIKTIEAVRSGNTNELATLLSVYKQGALNQNTIVFEDLQKYTLDELKTQVQKNTTGYEDGLVQLAYWDRLSKEAAANELKSRGTKQYTNQEWLTMNSPSVMQNKALIEMANQSGKDVVNIQGRNIPIGDLDKWNVENAAPLERYMESSTALATKSIEAFSTIAQVENLLPAVLGQDGLLIAAGTRIPFGAMDDTQAAGVLATVQDSLLRVPVDLQSDFAHLTQLRLQYTRSQKSKGPAGVTMRTQLEASMVHSAKTIRDKLGKILVDKYAGNKEAVAGANEFIATSKIDNAESATAIIQSQAITSTGMALDAATLDTYYEGSLSLIAKSLNSQMQTLYQQESATLPAGSSQMEFMAWLTKKNQTAPPDSFMMKKAVEANAAAITQTAFGKISNIHLAGALRNFAAKYKDIPEVANVAVQLQDGEQLVSALAKPEVQAPKEILTMLRNLELKLKQEKKLPESASLMDDFKTAAFDRNLLNQSVTVLKPKNEMAAAVDTLLFRGRIEDLYINSFKQNFSSATLTNIANAAAEVNEEQRAADEAAQNKNPLPIM